VAQDVLADALLLGPGSLGRGRAAGEDGVVARRLIIRWARPTSATMTPSIADEAVMLRTRVRSVSSVSSPGI
jgi:hypothetical protein